jgi:hypothetical protein
MTMPTFTQTPACGYVPSYVLTGDTVPSSGFVSQPFFTQPSTTLLQVQSNDVSLHG